MGKVLSADLYRLGKQKSTWLIPVCVFVLALVFGAMNGFVYGNAGWVREIHQSIADGISSVGDQDSSVVLTALFGVTFPSLADYVITSTQYMAIIAVVIFVSMYTAAVKRGGFAKNIGSIYNTCSYSAAQAIVILVFSVVISLVNYLGTVLSGLVFFENVDYGDIPKLTLHFLVVGVLWAAECLMIAILCDSFRNSTVGVVIGCLYTGIAASLLLPLVNLLISYLGNNDFKINHLLPYGFSEIVRFGVAESYLYGLALSAIYAAIFFGLRVLLRRRDIA